MHQDGLVIGKAPDFGLSIKGEDIFHKVSLEIWSDGKKDVPVLLGDRGLAALRSKVVNFVMAKTDYGNLMAGTNDFGICEVPERGIKITVNIVWNRRLSAASIATLTKYYLETFFQKAN